MKATTSKTILTLGLLAASLLPAAAGVTEADLVLRAMSAKLAASRSFTFEAKREVDPGLMDGVDSVEKSSISAAVQRPNKLSARATSRGAEKHITFDGRAISVLDKKSNLYATVPMRTSIDGLLARLDEQYGFTPPLAEFALSNPYADLRRQAHTITHLGMAKTQEGFFGKGVECHRIGLKGKRADAELWIAVGDSLPRKLVATFHSTGNPQVRITFSKWNLAAPAANFTFTPPQGAQKIEMWTTDKMQSAR